MGEVKKKESWIERLPIKIGKYLGLITVLLVATALIIGSFKTTVPGLGDMLTAETGAPDVRRVLFVCWEQSSCLTKNAKWNLWLDAIFLVPLYVVFFVCFQSRYYRALRDEDENRKPPKILGYPLDWRFLFFLPILAGAFDQIENFSTLYALYLLPENSPQWLHWLIHKSAWTKWGLVLLAAAFSLWLFSSWYFRPQRAGLRWAIGDILYRTKYAIAVILVYAILVLVMDQTRDAVVRQFLDNDFLVIEYLALGITAVAVWLMACSTWYWTRVVLRVKPTERRSLEPFAQTHTFAKWLARILGVAPLLISLALVFKIFQDLHVATDKVVLKDIGILGMSVFVLIALFLLMTSMRSRERRSGAKCRMGYYNCAESMEEAKDDFSLMPRFVFWGPLVVFVLSRMLSEIPEFPRLTFAMLSAGVAAWAGLFGWLAYESIRRTAPLLLLLVFAVAGIGLFGGSEIHEVLTVGESSQVDHQYGFWFRLVGVLVLAVIFFMAAITYFYFRKKDRVSGRVSGPIVIGVFVSSITLLLVAFDKGFPNNDLVVSDRVAFEDKDKRVSLNAALQDWLKRLYESICKNHGNAEKCAQSDDRTPVYFVSAEGGGIRAAYWPALVLAKLDEQIRVDQISKPELRIFSISGVSGGSIGAATFVACVRKVGHVRTSVEECIDRLGSADLVTQTLGGVLFEDAIASILPTSWVCSRPGCALFGRSYWFEGKLEAFVPELREATLLKPLDKNKGLSVPYVFLNATRVENGQRAIASTVHVDSHFFPGASDQAKVLSNDIRFSTAGHNSARFPYVNPVATAFGYKCPEDKPLLNKLGSEKSKRELCGHWVDGGYLDNSGAITTADILRAFRGCLGKEACAGGLSDKKDKKENEAEDAEIRLALRKRLVPIVLSIRNGIPQRKDCLNGQACIWDKTHIHDMAEHRPASPWRLLANALAPLVAISQSAASHAPLGEAKLKLEAEQLWQDFGLTSKNTTIATKPVRQIDQINDGMAIYPLGWMLSSRAQKQMKEQARKLSPELFRYKSE